MAGAGGKDASAQASAKLYRDASSVLSVLMKDDDSITLFNEPVDVEGLGLFDYLDVVKRPMDLGTIRTRLNATLSLGSSGVQKTKKSSQQQNPYTSIVAFEADVEQVFLNCLLYNNKGDPVYMAGASIQMKWRNLWRKATGRDASQAPALWAKQERAAAKASSQPAKPGAAGTRVIIKAGGSTREARAAAQPANAATPPHQQRERKQANIELPGSFASTKQMAKKPKTPQDALASKLQFALKAVKATLREPEAGIFAEPVDPVELGIPDYFDVIKQPMDLGTIIKELEKGRTRGWHTIKYKTPGDVLKDVALVWHNCFTYNVEDAVIRGMCRKCQTVFEREWARAGLSMADLNEAKRKGQWMMDDEDDEDDYDVQGTPPPAPPAKRKKTSANMLHADSPGLPPPPPPKDLLGPPPPPPGRVVETAEQKLQKKLEAAEEAEEEADEAALEYDAAEERFERVQREYEKQRERDEAILRGDVSGGRPLVNPLNGQPLVDASFVHDVPTLSPALWKSGVFFFQQRATVSPDPSIEALRLAAGTTRLPPPSLTMTMGHR